MRFTTTLEQSGKTATGFRVPPDVVEALGKGKRPPVVVTLNGYAYRNTVAVFGDVYMIGVSAEHRAAAGVKAGDVLEVDLVLDTAPRVVDVPPDFSAALVSYSNQSWHVLSIDGAKTDETRQRRIEKSIAALRDGRPR